MKPAKPLLFLLVSQFLASPALANMSIVNSKHNLSVTGPGEIRALVEDRICIFCHTPHHALSEADAEANKFSPLWNRALEPTNYILYESSTLSALPWQPTGPTRLCLSCHDGTVALGDVLQPEEDIMMTMELSAARKSYLDTDISDDHPVSFNYYDALPNPELAPGVPANLKSYGSGNIHCTSCHDPHDDTYGKFLVMDNNYSALCVLCHENKAGWTGSSHSSSTKLWDSGDMMKTVAEHGCESCHIPHTASGPKRLLRRLEEEQNCYSCHDGTVATRDIESQFNKFSRHPIEATTIDITGNAHDPAEDITFLQGHVECVDCHNPHAANDSPAGADNEASGRLALVAGKDQNDIVVDPIVYEYELCFKCHGYSSNSVPVITRWANENNTLVEFDTANPSYHPVVGIGRNSDMPSLPSTYEPDLTAESIISCIDCHDSDETPAIGGSGPRGPHGSIFRPILRQRYDTTNYMPESEAAYALCYRCHDRTKLMDDAGLYGGIKGHKSHVVDQRAPCSICHDPHGVRDDGNGDHTHLINFDAAVVQPYGGNATPIFTDNGTMAGSCALVCHDKEHDGSTSGVYP